MNLHLVFRGRLIMAVTILLCVPAVAGFSQTLLVASGNTVGAYNATTGATINASLITGVTTPVGLALADSNVLVSSVANDTIGKYDVGTGSAVNASFISNTDPLALAVSGTDLFVSHFSYSSIAKFNASTGAEINVNFITSGTISVYGMAVSDAGLLVSDAGYYQVRRFNPTTGAFIDAFITGLDLTPQAGHFKTGDLRFVLLFWFLAALVR